MPSFPEVIKERRKSDPEFVERSREYTRAYRERNLEKERERDRLGKAKKRSEDKETNNAYMRDWNAKNKDRLNAAERIRRATDKEYADKENLKKREYHKKNPLKRRNIQLKTNYGITLEDYNLMYEKQEGKCAICWMEKKQGGHDGLVVDHCHTKGKVRELLCASCNHGLGKFKDDIVRVQNALSYLMKHK